MRILPWIFRGRIRYGSLTLTSPDGFKETFAGSEPGPEVTILITDPSLDWKILLNPELRFTEGYMDGKIVVTSGTLGDFLMLYRQNKGAINTGAAMKAWALGLGKMRRFAATNNPFRSRQNVAHHYDIGNDLYELFLDEDMQYSCAYFPNGDETLEQAQLLKKRHIAAKLMLRPGQTVLDIGCGWGGLALYMAKVADVDVVGITLAEEQLRIARARAEAAGLSDRVRFELCDYRTLEGKFDRIVSVGMLEHVGIKSLDAYFARVRDLLKPDGVALIHSITSLKWGNFTDPFVKKHIFPGGYVPLSSEAMASIEKAGLWLLDFEVWRKHYAYTLRHWYDRFMANRDAAKAIFDERFCRMWEIYLLGFEASFLSGRLAVMQLQIGLTRDAAPLHRDYIPDEEAWLAAREQGDAGAEVIRDLPRRRTGSI